MGIMYEINRPAIVRETIALKATVENILMRPIKAVRTLQKAIAFRGRAVDVCTFRAS